MVLVKIGDEQVEVVGRLVDVGVDDSGLEEDELTLPDHYRGMVEVETRVFLKVGWAHYYYYH